MQYLKNNKKTGFTLIELIVVIVIMTSILILAIVSINEVSKKNRNKAWEKVKKEVELAATDYYETNSYKLGTINNASGYARVSVQKLVEDDYLNIVIDPRTGKKVNYCNYVEVKVVNNEQIYQYKENLNNELCDIEEIIVVKEIGAPSIDVKMSKAATGNNGYYIEPVDVEAYVSKNNNGDIKEIKYSFNDEEYNLLGLNDDNKYTVSAIDGKNVTVEFVVTNIHNNSATGMISYKKDTVKPEITSFFAKTTTKNYNSNNIRLSWDIKDTLSGLGTINTNLKNNEGVNKWNKNGASSWTFNDKANYFIADSSLSGKKIVPKLTVYDVAGNKTVANADDYFIYKECEEKVEGDKKTGKYGKCSTSCGTGTKRRTITIDLNDKYTGEYCSNKKVTEEKACSDKTDCVPLITNVSFRYNQAKCPTGHVEIKYKDINIDKYAAKMTYSHSVQGTNNTAEINDDSDDETFCRGYGLSSSNVMSFKVTIVNKLNTDKKATFKGECDWSKMHANGLNTDWHDCTLKK